MNNKQLQDLLSKYPDDMPIKIRTSGDYVKDMEYENVLHTSETAYVDDEAPEDEWDHEDGKVELGGGEQYLLINPIIY